MNNTKSLLDSIKTNNEIYIKNIAKSLFSLIKTNNGKFKSSQQAEFINKIVDSNGLFTSPIMQCYKGEYYFIFETDSVGVITVTKVIGDKSELYWETKSDEEYKNLCELRDELKNNALWRHKAQDIVNKFENEGTKKLIKMLRLGMSDEECIKKVKIYDGWVARIAQIEKKIDEVNEYHDKHVTKLLKL